MIREGESICQRVIPWQAKHTRNTTIYVQEAHHQSRDRGKQTQVQKHLELKRCTLFCWHRITKIPPPTCFCRGLPLAHGNEEVLPKRFILYSNTCTRSSTAINLPKIFLTDYILLFSFILTAAEDSFWLMTFSSEWSHYALISANKMKKYTTKFGEVGQVHISPAPWVCLSPPSPLHYNIHKFLVDSNRAHSKNPNICFYQWH